MDFIFPGNYGKQMYALTITTRNSNTKETFIKGLTQFLIDTKYPCRITGNLEYHHRKPTQIHLHGYTTFGNPPKNNKTNEYYFHQVKIKDKTSYLNWNEYLHKDSTQMHSKYILFDN